MGRARWELQHPKTGNIVIKKEIKLRDIFPSRLDLYESKEQGEIIGEVYARLVTLFEALPPKRGKGRPKGSEKCREIDFAALRYAKAIWEANDLFVFTALRFVAQKSDLPRWVATNENAFSRRLLKKLKDTDSVPDEGELEFLPKKDRSARVEECINLEWEFREMRRAIGKHSK